MEALFCFGPLFPYEMQVTAATGLSSSSSFFFPFPSLPSPHFPLVLLMIRCTDIFVSSVEHRDDHPPCSPHLSPTSFSFSTLLPSYLLDPSYLFDLSCDDDLSKEGIQLKGKGVWLLIYLSILPTDVMKVYFTYPLDEELLRKKRTLIIKKPMLHPCPHPPTHLRPFNVLSHFPIYISSTITCILSPFFFSSAAINIACLLACLLVYHCVL